MPLCCIRQDHDDHAYCYTLFLAVGIDQKNDRFTGTKIRQSNDSSKMKSLGSFPLSFTLIF